MADSQQIIITFRLRAALEYVERAPDPIYLFTRFDDRFGRELPGHTWNTVPEPVANRYESRWRSVFYDEAAALTFLAALTGAAPVAALAASIMREFAPPRTVVTTRIYDVRKDGLEVESVQVAQTGSAPAAVGGQNAKPQVAHPGLRFNWWVLAGGLAFALFWSVWTALVATWFERSPTEASPQPVSIDVSITHPQAAPPPPPAPPPARGERACPDCPVILRIRP